MFGNAKVLALAIGLAAVVVVLYNVHVNNIRNEINSQMIKFPRYNKEKSKGDKLNKARDIEMVAVPSSVGKGFGNVMDERLIEDGMVLCREVKSGNWVQVDDFIRAEDSGLYVPEKGVVIQDLKLAANLPPNNLIKPGGRVNILGSFPTGKGNNYGVLNIIDGVLVRGVGPRTITVELPQKYDPDDKMTLDVQVLNSISHAQGQAVMVQLRHSAEVVGKDLVLREEMKRLKFSTSFVPAPSEGSFEPAVVSPVAP